MENTSDQISFINTECSPSFIFNNMMVSENNIYYVHNSEIQPRVIVIDKKLVNKDVPTDSLSKFVTKLNGSETLQITSVCLLDINDTILIGVGLNGGFKLWSADGNRLLFQITNGLLHQKPYSIYAISKKFNKGLKNSILIGDSSGCINHLEGSESTWFNTRIFQDKQNKTVTALCSDASSGIFAMAFDNGDINVADLVNSNITILETFVNELELPCTSMCSIPQESAFGCAILNGELRIYSFSKLSLITIFQSHGRVINSLSILGNYLVTAGDDCYTNVLQYEKEKLKLIRSVNSPHKMVVGAQLIKNNEKMGLCMCYFDSPCIGYMSNIFK